tara:strand:- start:4622 stop:5215 length:594 start_codon:yes stop_codon:yes gene_type:complete
MNLNNYYYYFSKAIPDPVCDDIVRYAKTIEPSTAETGNKEPKDLKNVRDSNVVWLNDKWIYNEIWPFIDEANKKAGWNFEWDRSEDCQFTIYNQQQHYDWHCDSWNQPYNTPGKFNHGKIRKLSVTLLLSDPKSYEGGEFEFDFKNVRGQGNFKTCNEISEKGSLVVFPSFVWHRVRPVTQGTRYSLVIWSLGNPFK